MALAKWFAAKEVQLARQLVERLRAEFPPEMEQMNTNRARSLRKRGVEQLLQATAAFQKEWKPGLLKRLGFARQFQRDMNGAGYRDEFIKTTTAAALAELTRSGQK